MSNKCKLVLLLCLVQQIIAFRIPQVDFELENDGFRISLPDQTGIKYVGFQVNKNRPFTTYSEGEFSAVVRSKEGNRWTHKFNQVLKSTDTLYVWSSVQHETVIYRVFANPISVTSSTSQTTVKPPTGVTYSPPVTTTPRTTTTQTTTQRTIPDTTQRACAKTITEIDKRSACKGDLIFEDNFDNLDTSKWQHEIRFPLETGDNEFVLYATQAKVENGILNIKPIDAVEYDPKANSPSWQLDLGDSCTPLQNKLKECDRTRPIRRGIVRQEMPSIVVPRISTKESLKFKYGTIEVRAKMPKGDWIVPLIILEPAFNRYGLKPYASGQIRVAFTHGNDMLTINKRVLDGRMLFGGVVLSDKANERYEHMVENLYNEHLGNSFHTYKMVWGKENIAYYMDDVFYGNVTGPFLNPLVPYHNAETKNIAPFDEMFFITLGLSVGGFGDFPDEILNTSQNADSKMWENTDPKALWSFKSRTHIWKPTWSSPELQVDYIRVYAL